MANKPTEKELRQQNVAEAVSKTELFFQKNSKIIYGCVAAVLIFAVAYMAYNYFILQPKQEEAKEEMYMAEQRFFMNEFELALHGDDNNLGFKDIIENYGTKAGEAVYLYAGACALQIGEYNEAIEYFKKYDVKDKILLARSQAGIGDAYVNLGDNKSALDWFLKAAATTDNMYAAGYLLEAGQVAEELGDTAKALECYKEIKDQYPMAPEASDIDKYITRLEF